MAILTSNPNKIADKRIADKVRRYASTHAILVRYRNDSFRLTPISKVPENSKAIAIIDLRIGGKTISEAFQCFNNKLSGKNIDQIKELLDKTGIKYVNMGPIDWVALEPQEQNKRYKLLPQPIEKKIELSPGIQYRILRDSVARLAELTGENYGVVMDGRHTHFALTLNNVELDEFQSTTASGLREKLLNCWACLTVSEMSDNEMEEAYSDGIAFGLLSLLD